MDIANSAVKGSLFQGEKSNFKAVYVFIHSFRQNSQPDNALETQDNFEQTLKSGFLCR